MLETAKKLGGSSAKIFLINIVEQMPSYVGAQMPARFEQESKATAVDELTRMAKLAGLAAEIEVRVGHVAQDILNVADEKNADAIIIGSHRPEFQDYLLGSTASRVVRHANCSVVIIR